MNKKTKTTVIKLLPFLAVGISAVFYFFIPESGKVVVMGARPSKVEAVIDIDLPKPRIRIQDTFALYRNKILSILNLGGKVQEAEYNI